MRTAPSARSLRHGDRVAAVGGERHHRALRQRDRQREPEVVVGVLADQVDPPGRGVPDASSRHPEFPQSLGHAFGRDVADERVHRRLGGGQVLELGGAAPDRHQLDVEVAVSLGVGVGVLVQRRNVGQRSRIHPVEPPQHVEVDLREPVQFVLVEFDEVVHEPVRVDVHLDRPARGERHERGEQLGAARRCGCRRRPRRPVGRQRGCRRGAFDVRAPAPAWRRFAASDRGSRRSDRADGSASRRFPRRGSRNRTPARYRAWPSGRRCGAATRRRPAGHAPVPAPRRTPVWSLEKQITSQRPCPGRGHEAVTGGREGTAAGAGQAGEPVLEHDDVVVGGGHLAGQPGRPRAQRALVGRRLVGAVLAQRRDDHPLPRCPVEPQLRLLPGRAPAAACDRRPAPDGARAARRTAGHGHRPASPASALSRCRRLAWPPRRSSGNHDGSSRARRGARRSPFFTSKPATG